MPDIYEIFDEMREYAREHPNATFLCADDQRTRSYGWIAYEVIDGVEYNQQWTIGLSLLWEQFRRGRDHPDQLTRATSRQEHLRRLVASARRRRVQEEPPTRTRTLWERLDDDAYLAISQKA